jgi:hypothetical protein
VGIKVVFGYQMSEAYVGEGVASGVVVTAARAEGSVVGDDGGAGGGGGARERER